MKIETDDLSLFGYDLRESLSWFRLAWRELLWDTSSPLLKSLEEPVQLFNASSSKEIGIFRGGQRVAGVVGDVKTMAVCMADDDVLIKSLHLPLAVEADLPQVMEFESTANSPFSCDDTVSGWSVTKRDDVSVFVDLLIVHRADARKAIQTVPAAEELWANASSGLVMLRGFGEANRQQRYLKSIKLIALKCLIAFSLICAAPAMVSSFRYVQMEKVQAQFQELKRSSEPAVLAREELARGNELMEKFSELISEHPEPLYYLKLLTETAGDDIWLRNFNLKGMKLQVTGYALDATSFIQQLSQLEQFSQVKQRGGIRRDNASGREVFTLDISLNPSFEYKEVAQ